MDSDKLRSLLKELLIELLVDNLEVKIEKARGEIEVKLTLFEETISSDRIYL